MPATFMNFASFSLGAMMKSSPVLWARMPANEVMMSRVESDGTDLRAVLKTPFVPSAVVEQSSFFVYVDCARTYEQVAVNGRGDENTLAHL